MDRTYVLTIKNDTKDTSPQQKQLGGAGGISMAEEVDTPTPTTNRAFDMLGKLVGTKAVMGYAMQGIDYRVSQVGLFTGSQQTQQRTQYVYSRAKSIATSTASGAMVGGGVGAVAGLLYGVISTVMNDTITRNTDEITAQYNRNYEMQTQNLQSARATFSGSRRQNATME